MASLKVTGRAIKISVVVDPAGLIGVNVPLDQPRFPLTVEASGVALHTELSSKSVRKCAAAVAAAKPGEITVLLQGKLVSDGRIEDAGISAAAGGTSERTALRKRLRTCRLFVIARASKVPTKLSGAYVRPNVATKASDGSSMIFRTL